MSTEEIGGIVRALLAAIGGYFVAQGVIDTATVTAIAGAGATLVAAIWSVIAKRSSPPAP